jgi:hypothetical protein
VASVALAPLSTAEHHCVTQKSRRDFGPCGVPHWRSDRRGGSFYYRYPQDQIVSKAVKKAISLPADLAAEAEAIAREENKSLSAVVQDALRALKRTRLRSEFRDLQGYWSTRARAKGVLSERELERLLRR